MPDISKITLPSGTTYDIKDATARSMISGGVSFVVAWDGSTTPVIANIPAGVTVTYNNVSYTGTLSAESAQAGAFYLVKSASTPASETLDIYDEYVPIGATGSKSWEKIGDTQVNLADVVTGVTLNKSTDTVIGTDATFTITQPTISLSVTPTEAAGRVSFNHVANLTKKYLSATATGGAVSASGDSVTAVTGYSAPTTTTVVGGLRPTASKLATTTVTGVSGSTTASKVTAAAAQTTATGGATASSTNTDWLKGVSVSDETLTIGAATMNTQTTTQFTASNVTVPVAASSATTVATGSTALTGSGATVLTDIEATTTPTVLTGLGTASTDTVLGTGSTFSVTNPTITISAGNSGDTEVVTNGTEITGYLRGVASGANTAWNSKDSVTVLTNSTSLTVTKDA